MSVANAPGPYCDGLAEEVVSIVLAGGKGSRLHDLTQEEAKPALPIGPGARLVDYTLANVANSGFRQAMVLTQYAPDTLRDHVERCWGSFTVLDGEDHGP
ncbi:sugar phosphate nucleotidyltransferase, partial [Novosphingobium sp. AP12]|uniref:sugar phosphate nucleotidyltransferase n=1 Tax=Novosphingobium sp. AP12 TaxID=1144305 RepID=UPI000271E2B5